MSETYTATAYKSFTEETPGQLVNKEFHFVALGAAEDSIKLAESGDEVIGVMVERYAPDLPEINVRLLNRGGTVKVKAGGIIPKNGRVVFGAGGLAIAQPAAAGSYRTLGRKLSQGNSATNDVIEILDVIEPVVIA
ncbi:hypothetical protein JIN85_19475 [Luteolibacter pohnpeiensis]|uniref:DUF2190 domain-containing protein n=1 Tax=Luteolibacter pohnpeiensis TaxID=454153 RepID=A0A934S8B5_9BACT|nr:hypothetical protein [Luteolibacter pohnpeiensis]MBK1884606.1 hypothetical protein [Luteolibacter pohnpeiensis]